MSGNEVEYLGSMKVSADHDIECLSGRMTPSANHDISANRSANDDLVDIKQEEVDEDFEMDESVWEPVDENDLPEITSENATAPYTESSTLSERRARIKEAFHINKNERIRAKKAEKRDRLADLRSKTHRTHSEERELRYEEERRKHHCDQVKKNREAKKARDEQNTATIRELEREVQSLKDWKEGQAEETERQNELIYELELEIEYWERKALAAEAQE